MDYPPQPLILSVEDSVGRGGANRRLDVMLVQFFLHVTAQADEKSWGWTIDRKFTELNVAYYGTFGANAISRSSDHPLMPRELARTFRMHGRSW
jgi:hypothetical protein